MDWRALFSFLWMFLGVSGQALPDQQGGTDGNGVGESLPVADGGSSVDPWG